MTEETEQKPDGVKSPPPSEFTTSLGRVFEFRKPALRHRNIIMKVLKVLEAQTADYEEILKCAKERGMSVEAFIEIPEEEYTETEMKRMLKHSDPKDQIEFAEMMNEILVETLYATIKAAPFKYSTMEEFEEKMDDYAEAVELFPTATKWVAQAALDLKRIKRKN